jgi:hypothetical protein
MPESHFDWTKPSQESFRRTKWCYVPLVRLFHYFKKKICRASSLLKLSNEPSLALQFNLPDNFNATFHKCQESLVNSSVSSLSKVNINEHGLL